jgi:cell wall-associated NlpC family hydrolase
MMKNIQVIVLLLLLSFSAQSQKTELSAVPEKTAGMCVAFDRSELVTFAKKYLGTPYRRATADPEKGFDCSGFVTFVFNHFNIALPRSSREYKSLGVKLKPEEFKVGDVLVFYGHKNRSQIGHVAIVCEANGMKSRFIHASSGKAHSVTISDLNSAGYRVRFYKCIDVIRQ